MSSASAFNSLSARLGKGTGSGLFMGWVSIPDPTVAGLVAREGFDAVTLDMQHGFVDVVEALQSIAQVALAGKPALVRIPVGGFPVASRVLDAGAAGIIAPMVNSVADAKAFVSYTKYPPVGERSWGPGHAMNLSGLSPSDYLAKANGLTAAIAMIETREAMAALDDILAVPGIDGVLVGPSDLSIALSNGAHVDPHHKDVEAALDHVAARCKAHGKAACTFAISGERGRILAQRGYDLIAVGNDVAQFRAGIQSFLKAAKG